jgi:hypothetical protein
LLGGCGGNYVDYSSKTTGKSKYLNPNLATQKIQGIEKYEIDLSTYDDKFFRLAEDLIHFCFDPEAAEAIMFYIYARTTDSGEIQSFTDPEGNHHKFESVDDLWEYMLIVAEKNMDDEI